MIQSKILFKCIFLSYFLIITCVEAAIGKKEFESIQEISEIILSKYPPEIYAYVGIGRSPVPILAYLKNKPNTCTQNLPLTRFKFDPDYFPLTNTQENILSHHFDRFVPSKNQLNGREKILLIDFVVTGETLSAAHKYLERYFYFKKITDIEVSSLGIAPSYLLSFIKKKSPYISDFIERETHQTFEFDVQKDDHVLYLMAFKLYRNKAEFIGFNIQNPFHIPNTPRKEYIEFTEELKHANEEYKSGRLNDNFVKSLIADPVLRMSLFKKNIRTDRDFYLNQKSKL